jgi:hypothetical protein
MTAALALSGLIGGWASNAAAEDLQEKVQGLASDPAWPALVELYIVPAWMDSSANFAVFRKTVADSLDAFRLENTRLKRELTVAQNLAPQKESALKWWLLPVAATVGVYLGTLAAR